MITNCDDSYRELEELGIKTSGKIRVEITRKRGSSSSIVRVLDRASGMSSDEMYTNIGIVGGRTSGFEQGKLRRGLYGRGAKDVAFFGLTHFESIKDDRYSHLTISPSLKCEFKEQDRVATKIEREKLGIPRGNGTVVTIETNSGLRIPQHEKLGDILSRYYSLRDIMSDLNRELILFDVNTGKSAPLIYQYPDGEVILATSISVPGYPEANIQLLIKQHETPFQSDTLPLREGILIKSGAAIHDCTHFQLESDVYCWRFTGEMRCDYIDKLVKEYDDLEETSDNPIHPSRNPILLLDPDRDGLVENHPLTMSIKQSCRKLLRGLIDDLKAKETTPKKNVSDEYLDKKLDSLSKAVSKIFENKLKELDEEVNIGTEPLGTIENLQIGLHIIPPGEEHITVNIPKVFTVKIVGYEELNESLPITIVSSNPAINVRLSTVYLRKFSEDNKIATTTFTLESDAVGAESLIEVNYNGYDNVILVDVIEPLAPLDLPLGLSFDKANYRLRINKEKTLYLWLNAGNNVYDEYQAEVTSDRQEIVIKGGGKCVLKNTGDPKGIYKGTCHVIGRRSKTKGNILVQLQGFQSSHTSVVVEDKEQQSHIKLQFIPDEDDFGSVRYKWDDEKPYIFMIAAKHPSVRQYLGIPQGDNYPGIDSQLYHCVLAEVVAEALAFNILERQFRTEGQQGMLDYTTVDANYHKHYSDFLTICHQTLNSNTSNTEILFRQSKLF